MRKLALVIVALVATAVAGACTGHSGGSGSPSPTPATIGDLRYARKLVIAPSPTPTNVGGSCGEPLPTGELVKVDSAGNLTPVLNTPYEAAYFLVTSANVVVRGAGLVTSTDGVTQFPCCILAIPRSVPNQPIRCLSQSTPYDGFGGLIGDVFDDKGIKASSDAIVFEVPPANEVHRWDGHSGQIEVAMQLSDPLDGVYTATGAGNICAASGYDPGKLICGDPAVNTYSIVSTFGSETFQVGRFVWNESASLDLATLDVMALTTGFTPHCSGCSVSSKVPLSDGTFVTVGSKTDGLSLVLHLVPPNLVERVPIQAPPGQSGWVWSEMIGSDDYAFVSGELYGPPYSKDLRLIDLTTLTAGTANYLSQVHLLEVASMEFAGPDVFEIDGTGTNGLASSVYIDAVSGTVTAAPSQSERYIQAQSIQ